MKPHQGTGATQGRTGRHRLMRSMVAACAIGLLAVALLGASYWRALQVVTEDLAPYQSVIRSPHRYATFAWIAWEIGFDTDGELACCFGCSYIVSLTGEILHGPSDDVLERRGQEVRRQAELCAAATPAPSTATTLDVHGTVLLHTTESIVRTHRGLVIERPTLTLVELRPGPSSGALSDDSVLAICHEGPIDREDPLSQAGNLLELRLRPPHSPYRIIKVAAADVDYKLVGHDPTIADQEEWLPVPKIRLPWAHGD